MPASGISGLQSALDPQGPNAAAIAEIAWVLFAGGALVFVLVMALAAWAVLGERRAWLASRGAVVAGGIVLPAVVLFALLVYTLAATSRTMGDTGEPDLRIELVGHQWWWQVRYLDAAGEPDFETANEIRIPAGASVELRLASADVLHSFWVPSLAGKLDMIPGKDNRLRFSAARPGQWRGQCAEYCGGPHAQMALYVIAHSREDFEAWREAQRRPARGAHPLFLARCAACHRVRGTPAAGTLGPDLTHVGSRVSLGAGILPNTPGALAGWIGSSQHLKPGNLMPEFRELSGEELRGLAAYLAGLE